MIKEFFRYLKHPVYIRKEPVDGLHFFLLIFFYFILAIPAAISSNICVKLEGLSKPEFDSPFWQLFITVVFLAPLFEETLFRMLLRPVRQNLWVFSIIITGLSVYRLIKGDMILGIILAVLGVGIIPFFTSPLYRKKLQRNVVRYFPWFFYASVMAFGFVHVTNFHPLSLKVLLLAPFLTLPQLIMGTLLGFVRMKYGIIYSMLLHSTINLIGFMLSGAHL